MEQRTEGLFAFVPFEKNIELEQRFEKKLYDVNSFNITISNIKEMITFFEDKNKNQKRKVEL